MAEVNEMIGGYTLRSLLQTGAFSQVFEVVEPKSHLHYAMKILLPEHADNSEQRKVLFHEARVGKEMRHPNVINIHKVSQDDKNPHFIMEFFPSGSLRKRLMSKDPRDKEFIKTYAKKIFKEMATGLAYMNSSGYVHRDVKPDNVLVNAIGQTKIIDFAITRKEPTGFFEKLFAPGRVRQGTHSFMSPEQIRNEKLDGRADIYSYGITIFELLCGRPPFRGSTQDDLLRKHLTEKPVPLTSYNDDVTDEFSAFVLKLIAKKKEDRPATFHEVLMQLKKLRVLKSVPDYAEEEQH
ncbi:serine/threonine-protein kinase [soil metagenome]